MTEHQIRFRGGWEVEPRPGFDFSRRVTLPITWPEALEGPIRLIRRFGRPPANAANEANQLELIRVPGLLGIHLNGENLAVDTVNPSHFRVNLVEPLAERNSLVLEIDLGIAVSRGLGRDLADRLLQRLRAVADCPEFRFLVIMNFPEALESGHPASHVR